VMAVVQSSQWLPMSVTPEQNGVVHEGVGVGVGVLVVHTGGDVGVGVLVGVLVRVPVGGNGVLVGVFVKVLVGGTGV
jgi:hypothetical protein